MKRHGDELTRHEQTQAAIKRANTRIEQHAEEKPLDERARLPFGLNRDHDMTEEDIADHKARMKEQRIERNKRKKEAQNEARTIENNERFVKAILDKGGKHENISSDVREHKPG